MPFEFDFDYRKKEDVFWLIAFAMLVIALLVGVAQTGRNATPLDTGAPRLLGWSDWRLLQAQRAFASELSVLRVDVMRLSRTLDLKPDPVATQILIQQIARHTKDGDPSLSSARLALENAALNVRDWSTGTLERDTAILSVQDAIQLLEQ